MPSQGKPRLTFAFSDVFSAALSVGLPVRLENADDPVPPGMPVASSCTENFTSHVALAP